MLGKDKESPLKAAFLGQGASGSDLTWPTLSELAKESKVDPMKVARQIPGWRRAWSKLPGLTHVRAELAELLTQNGGVSSQKPQLLTNAGLLKRYSQLGLLEKLREQAGARDGIPGVWLLLPTEETSDLPTLDGQAIARLDSGQRARIPTSWLENRHRAAGQEVAS